MMIRRGVDRGRFNHGWLDTYHTFSFGDYQDSRYRGFRSLRVINEDRVAAGQGFGMHPHRDMEILTYVLSGELEHQDSLGNRGRVRPGDVQYMAAGTGVEHSEFNPSATEPVHLIQIWIKPDRCGAPPTYEQRRFPSLAESGRLTLLASGDGHDGSIRINQDARLMASALRAGQSVRHEPAPGRGAWVQVTRGEVDLDGQRLVAGDGASLTEQPEIVVTAVSDAEVLLFDLM